MNKKVILGSLCGLSLVNAEMLNGFSIGGGILMNFAKYDVKSNNAVEKFNTRENQWGVNVFMSYIKTYSEMFTGFDLGLGFEQSKKLTYTSQGVRQGEFNIRPGIAFHFGPLVGYKFNQTTGMYGKLGFDVKKLKVKWSAADAGIAATAPNYSSSKTVLDVTPTIGIVHALSENVSLRSELGYKLASKKTFNHQDKINAKGIVLGVSVHHHF